MADSGPLVDHLNLIVEPTIGRPLGELDIIGGATLKRGAATIDVRFPVPGEPHEHLIEAVTVGVRAFEGVRSVTIDAHLMDDEAASAVMERLQASIRKVGGQGSRTQVIAVSSGKGGVGKSSLTVNLAVALANRGRQVGILDADVWGFSIPGMLGSSQTPPVFAGAIIPPILHGVKVISMDFFIPSDQAVIWRGPMLHKALDQFLSDVFWDDPDFLLIDMPPGTGDIAISISQYLPKARQLLVTTPQPTAQRVAKRAALMAAKVNQDVIGVVENMSWFTADDGTRYYLFGEGGGADLADDLNVDLLAQIPLVPAMREGADEGLPVSIVAPGSDAALAFELLADEIEARKPRIRTHPDLVIG
ncbi:MAG TPA: ATP-binding protein [Actinobacteria bacterium]|nr:ATP-binding protein [Actinomycetota bacterium]